MRPPREKASMMKMQTHSRMIVGTDSHLHHPMHTHRIIIAMHTQRRIIAIELLRCAHNLQNYRTRIIAVHPHSRIIAIELLRRARTLQIFRTRIIAMHTRCTRTAELSQ